MLNYRLKKAKMDELVEGDPSEPKIWKPVEEDSLVGEAEEEEESSMEEDEDCSDEVEVEEEEEEVVVDLMESGALCAEPVKLGIRDFCNPDDLEAYKAYRKEFFASEGFDIHTFPPFPDRRMVLGVDILRPVLMQDGDPFHDQCKKGLLSVLPLVNAKYNTCLEFQGICSANRVSCGDLFYATLKARDTTSLQSKLYQAILHPPRLGGPTRIFMFREKPANPPDSIGEDSADDELDESSEEEEEERDRVSEVQRKVLQPYKLKSNHFSNPADFKTYKTYQKQFLESDGFDVETFPPLPDPATIVSFYIARSIPLQDGDPDYECCEKGVQSVISYRNAKYNTSLEFLGISRAATHLYRGNYYITFMAKDTSSGTAKLYQTQITYATSPPVSVMIYCFRERGTERATGVMWR